MKILVTDGDSRAALAVTRALGSKGHEVVVANCKAASLSSRSRYCAGAVSYPDPARDRKAFVSALRDAVAAHRIDVLIPVTDVCVFPIAEHMAQFESVCKVPLPSHETLAHAADKARLYETAKGLGVPAPKTTVLKESGDTANVQLPEYPLVIKPRRSRVPSDNGWIETNVSYAATRRELDDSLGALPAGAFPVLLQERVTGPGIGQFYCYDRGRVIAAFAHRRLRERPPSGGISVLRESVALHPRAHELSLALLDHLRWHGVAMVEFKLDERDQVPKLMEINGRFWGSLQLAIDCGMDFPSYLLQIAEGRTVSASDNYTLGIRSRWLWGEIDLLLMYMLKSSGSLKLPAGHKSRFRSIIEILSPYVAKQRLEVLRLSDPMPWVFETTRRFSRRR